MIRGRGAWPWSWSRWPPRCISRRSATPPTRSSGSRRARARPPRACSSPTGRPTSPAAARSWARSPVPLWRRPSGVQPRSGRALGRIRLEKGRRGDDLRARTRGAVARLERVLGPSPDGLARATALLQTAVDPLRPEGKPLYAGLLSLGLPGEPLADAWRLADMLREYRGDAHIAAWTSANLDATEIGLLTEPYWGIPLRTYVRTRAWSDDQLDAAEKRLVERGRLADGALTDEGKCSASPSRRRLTRSAPRCSTRSATTVSRS